MRSPLVLVLLLLLAIVVGGVAFWLASSAAPPPPLTPLTTGPGAGDRPVARDAAAPPPGLPDGTVAMRTRPVVIEAEVADAPTACLLVVDHADERPLAGAVVRLVQSGADVAFTDDEGLAPVPLKQTAQLAVVLDGYLMRLAPTPLGSTRDAPQLVRLVRDELSIARRFEFVGPGGERVDDVFVLFGAARGNEALQPSGDAVVGRAWHEQFMLAGREVARDVAFERGAGRGSTPRAHRLASGATVRFAARGSYLVHAATATGLAALADCLVTPGPQPPPVRVALRPGAFASGHVRDLEGAPIVGATLRVVEDEPLGLVATTDAQGAFSIGPLAAGRVTLSVTHELHDGAMHGPVPAASGDLVVRLTPLARQPVRGRVRSLADAKPIADALVAWQAPGGGTTTVKTQADGTFVLPSLGADAGTLRVQAAGHVAYAELVAPDAPFADYELLPADTATRLESGMTATLEGVVQAADGTPAVGVAVRWQPARASAQQVAPGRRVLEGAVLELPLVTTTGADGAFVLETTQFGPGRLSLAGDPDNALDLTAVAGRSTTGLKLTR